jgi:hypothetical protein
LLVIGSVVATAILGFLIGLRGGVAMAAAGFGVAVIIAVLDFVQIYPGGINRPSPAWPWAQLQLWPMSVDWRLG